ncbi:MAG TPA: TonB family protein [Opitutus sp.]|nr:TonB family protein [Opitutus sp.]
MVILLVAGCGCPAARVAAQDVVVSAPAWIDQDDPPDQLPTLRLTNPEFPRELEKTADIGWAEVELFIDDRGRLRLVNFRATQPAYRRAVDTGEFLGPRDFRPAQRNGKPVNSRIRISVAFNPASAERTKADATPQLLAAVPAIEPAWEPANDESSHDPETVWAQVEVDAEGHVTGVREAPGEFADIIKQAARAWRFAPARRGGKPVAAEVRVPFIVVPPDWPVPNAKKVVPVRVLTRVEPVYPQVMNVNRINGEVRIGFVVDIEGRPRQEHVLASSNPVFDEPALTAIRAWKFEPQLIGGVPVACRVQQTFAFKIPEGGTDGFEVKKRAKLTGLPENLRYDTAAKIESFAKPVYPFALLKQDRGGSAQVSAVVDESGDVVATKIVQADPPELGLALQSAMERFHYLPALKNGQPIQSMSGFEQKFDAWDERMVSPADRAALRLEEKHPERIAKADQLDRQLKVAHAERPVYPVSVTPRVDGTAKIEFLVDDTGHVRIPRILAASKDEFGYAAVQAVAAWTFEPPTSKGKGVTVRVIVPIDFHPVPAEPGGDESPAKTR